MRSCDAPFHRALLRHCCTRSFRLQQWSYPEQHADWDLLFQRRGNPWPTPGLSSCDRVPEMIRLWICWCRWIGWGSSLLQLCMTELWIPADNDANMSCAGILFLSISWMKVSYNTNTLRKRIRFELCLPLKLLGSQRHWFFCLLTNNRERGRSRAVWQPGQEQYVPIDWKSSVNTSVEGNVHTALKTLTALFYQLILNKKILIKFCVDKSITDFKNKS